MSRLMVLVLAAAIAVAAACGKREETLTPEQKRARGDEILKKMSATAAAARTFSYETDEVRERVRRNGEKVEDKFTRKVIVRRPDGLTYTQAAGERAGAAWYDGKSVTIALDGPRVWARGPVPPTLDEALDYLSVEYALNLPTADLLYSNPYEALISPQTTGGWVDVQEVGTRSCDHLAYQEGQVAWELWVTHDDKATPCKIEITYGDQPGKPKASVVFRDWNSGPVVTDATFAPVVPAGFTRIKLMRHASQIDEPEATPPAGETPQASAPPARR
jgi:hypothetical protein